jgi:ornithine cyclodeaminase/alanine dehydrogenase-like protein (mu-crystallin family)
MAGTVAHGEAYTAAMVELPPLRYLSRADVVTAMPPLAARIELAEATLRGLAGPAELPAKIAVHPRPAASFAHAMPAFLRGGNEDGSTDRLGIKWVLGFPANAAAGLPAIGGLLLLNDPATGIALAILDAGPITAERTAAVSGVAIRTWAAPADFRAPRVAVIGAGVQGHSHVAVIGHVLPGTELRIFDPDPDRSGALAEVARHTAGIAAAVVASSPRDAVEGADVVVSAASFVPPPERQSLTNGWLVPHALVVPVDYATYCAAEVARDAALFVTDHRDQFLANREAGQFDGYPEPAMIGERLNLAGSRRPAGRIVATHLGTGLADVVLGTAIAETAARLGLGTILAR